MPVPSPTAAAAEWRYGKPAIVLHWLLALLIVVMAALGWFMMTVEHEPGGEKLFDLHKSIGIVVFVLVLARVFWRMGHKPAPLPAGTPVWQVKLSALVEGLLYVFMVLMPVTGILGALYSRAGLAFFGLPLSGWLTPDRATAKLMFNIHSWSIWVLAALVVLHAAAGLKHLLVDRDQVFRRMWPG